VVEQQVIVIVAQSLAQVAVPLGPLCRAEVSGVGDVVEVVHGISWVVGLGYGQTVAWYKGTPMAEIIRAYEVSS
jgi:hypothetical protein